MFGTRYDKEANIHIEIIEKIKITVLEKPFVAKPFVAKPFAPNVAKPFAIVKPFVPPAKQQHIPMFFNRMSSIMQHNK
jgi:hypothetical protein